MFLTLDSAWNLYFYIEVFQETDAKDCDVLYVGNVRSHTFIFEPQSSREGIGLRSDKSVGGNLSVHGWKKDAVSQGAARQPPPSLKLKFSIWSKDWKSWSFDTPKIWFRIFLFQKCLAVGILPSMPNWGLDWYRIEQLISF